VTRSKQGALLSIVEAAYAVERPEGEWLGGILDALNRAYPAANALCAYTFDASNPAKFKTGNWVWRGDHSAFPDFSEFLPLLTPDYIQRTWGKLQVARALAEPGMPRKEAYVEKLQTVEARDSLNVNGVDGSGNGIFAALFLPRSPSVRNFIRGGWTRVATHLATAARLRRMLASVSIPASSDAVLTPSGRVVDANGDASERASLDALRRAVAEVERARSGRSFDTETEAIHSWKALVAARWSLVDSFESDGRRYLVARRNSPNVRRMAALSRREREVVELAGAGHTNKLIAYALGISASTVGVLLHRAAGKLEVKSRNDLVKRYRDTSASDIGGETSPKGPHSN